MNAPERGAHSRGEPVVKRFDQPREVAAAAAELFVERASQAVEDRGRFCVALSGGSSPLAMYGLLAGPPLLGRVPWARVWLFWGDERCVPPDHPDSNYGAARDAFLRHVSVPDEQIYRIRGELDPRLAAQAYEDDLRGVFGAAEAGPPTDPTFDLAFLGMGEDGHTASLFPHTTALSEQHRWVIANYIAKFERWRITLTAPALNAVREVVFLVSGAPKQAALRQVLEGSYEPETYPAQLIDPPSGRVSWLVDQAAAADLAGPA